MNKALNKKDFIKEGESLITIYLVNMNYIFMFSTLSKTKLLAYVHVQFNQIKLQELSLIVDNNGGMRSTGHNDV